MNTGKYLYGASVQGIQNFIFQTSKLREIVGASELVEQICTTTFRQVASIKEGDENIILNAAGNIKYIFDSKQKCQGFVRIFPKVVMEMAPGITISQAVVEVKEDENTTEILENRLKTQRNKGISITNGAGLMVTETARKTGGIGFKYGKGKDSQKVVDKAQVLKEKVAEGANRKLLKKIVSEKRKFIDQFPFDIKELSGGEENNSWIAVVHADGNNLGQVIIEMVKGISQDASFKVIKKFSELLDQTTVGAAKKAFESVINEQAIADSKFKKIPFRPVVLGGDDLTVIVRGDLALNFTEAFLQAFEYLSKRNFEGFAVENKLENDKLLKNGLTACAGISYIKANYPFHYGVTLAEDLCKEAKRISKKLNKKQTPSSIMFHKVHASFVEEYEDIIDAELKTKHQVYFNYGPYFIHSQSSYSTISELKNRTENINRQTAPKAGLRNWLTELNQNPESANQLLLRLTSLYEKKYPDKDLLKNWFTDREVEENGEKSNRKYTPIFDIIALSGIQKSGKI